MGDGTISGNATLLKRFTNLINVWYGRVDTMIWKKLARAWDFDDRNYTDLPIATTDLVDGQQDYSLPSWARRIERAEVLDSDGDYQLLTQIDKSQVGDEAMTEFEETAGLPIYYDLVANSIFLYPKPDADDVTLSDGLKVYFNRSVDLFTSTDTTKEPGFPSEFHRILSAGASYDYVIAEGMTDKLVPLKNMINEMMGDVSDFYARRDRDFTVRMTPHWREHY